MSDKQISVGDLVMVVRGRTCCAHRGDIGAVHRVSGFYPSSQCAHCGAVVREPVALVDGKYEARGIDQLKRIPPDILKDDIPTHSEVTA
jgi:hypothetical protein